MPSWVQCIKTGKFIPKEEYYSQESVNAPTIFGEFKEFISPVTKELITDRGQLRQHNARHGITSSSDYSPEYIAKRAKKRDDEMTGNTAAHRQDRREAIHRALSRSER